MKHWLKVFGKLSKSRACLLECSWPDIFFPFQVMISERAVFDGRLLSRDKILLTSHKVQKTILHSKLLTSQCYRKALFEYYY